MEGRKILDKRQNGKDQIETYLAKVNHYLEFLDEKIGEYNGRIRKLSILIELAVALREKRCVVRGLRRKSRLKKELNFYLGQKKDLNRIRWAIKQTTSTRQYKKLLEQGIEVINKIKVPLEKLERVKVEAGDVMEERDVIRDLVSEPLRSPEMDELEERAEELIAERSLPRSKHPSEGTNEGKEVQENELNEIEKEFAEKS